VNEPRHRKLLGFDIRQCPGDYLLTDWNRESFLLKPDIKRPLSVDTDIWPSVFDDFEESEIPKHSLRPSVWVWFDLKAMEAFFMGQNKVQNRRGVRLGVELIIEKPLHGDDFWEGVLGPYSPLSPGKIPSSWMPLGYDVADRYQVSGLSNCAYEQSEKGSLQSTWESRLNEHGLFHKQDDAISFRDITDKRVQDHAPFYVYALFRDPAGCR